VADRGEVGPGGVFGVAVRDEDVEALALEGRPAGGKDVKSDAFVRVAGGGLVDASFVVCPGRSASSSLDEDAGPPGAPLSVMHPCRPAGLVAASTPERNGW
jgi:hypothetical protein